MKNTAPIFAALLLTACWKAPPQLPLYTFQATCNGEVSRFTAMGLSNNDDANETHRAYITTPPTASDDYWHETVIARFEPTCSIVRVDLPHTPTTP